MHKTLRGLSRARVIFTIQGNTLTHPRLGVNHNYSDCLNVHLVGKKNEARPQGATGCFILMIDVQAEVGIELTMAYLKSYNRKY